MTEINSDTFVFSYKMCLSIARKISSPGGLSATKPLLVSLSLLSVTGYFKSSQEARMKRSFVEKFVLWLFFLVIVPAHLVSLFLSSLIKSFLPLSKIGHNRRENKNDNLKIFWSNPKTWSTIFANTHGCF